MRLKLPQWIAARVRRFRVRRHPVFLRVVDADGRPVPRVELVGSYLPSRESFRAERVTDRVGTCVVQWVSGAERMRLVARHGDAEAELEVAADRYDPERVIQVRLAVARG